MAVKIRLTRMGVKKKPYYRLVVANAEAKRDGRFLEIIGSYDPNQDPPAVNIQKDRLQNWLDRGAQPTDTVASLIKRYNADIATAAPEAVTATAPSA